MFDVSDENYNDLKQKIMKGSEDWSSMKSGNFFPLIKRVIIFLEENYPQKICRKFFAVDEMQPMRRADQGRGRSRAENMTVAVAYVMLGLKMFSLSNYLQFFQ